MFAKLTKFTPRPPCAVNIVNLVNVIQEFPVSRHICLCQEPGALTLTDHAN